MEARKARSRSGGNGKSKKGGVTANPLARAVAAAKTMNKKGRVTAALSKPHRATADVDALARKVSAARTNRRKEEVTQAMEESQRRR
jgi:alkyl hydroperoxide reductase subunit AhpC